MHCNITYVRKVKAKLVKTKAEVLEVDFLSIGSGHDQDLILDDVYVIQHHAEIVLHKKKMFITAVDGENTGGISVNNQLIQSKKLKKGDVFNFGNFEITVLAINPANAQLDLQVEQKTDGIPATRVLPSRTSLSLEDTWLRKRSWSVKGFILLLVFFLIIPLLSFFMSPHFAEMLRSTPIIPSDNSWISGSLAHAHHIDKIGDNCNKCHQKPFVMVEDNSCANSECHKRIQEHVDPELYSKNNLEKKRCGSCHKEHNGNDNNLVDTNDSLCFSCHHAVTEEGRYDKKREIQNVLDLDDSHPEVRISMHKLNRESMKFNIERYSLDDIASLKEESNLKFPHDKHLVYKGLENKTTGETDFKMMCDSCHVLSLAGDGFKPVTRKEHCQDCHLLTFEPEFPNDREKQVPHGNVANVLDYLRGYYSNRALKGEREESRGLAKVEGTSSPRRFRPGENAISNEKDLSDKERITVHQWVEKQVDIASKELFNSTTCTLCHNVIENQNNDPAWSVLPVRINEVWFPKVKLFNHKKHTTEECVSCHNKLVGKDNEVDVRTDVNLDKNDKNRKLSKAETPLTSSDSSDILMPKLGKCKECHTSKGVSIMTHTSKMKSKTSCVKCHGFHTDKKHLMNRQGQGEKEE